MQQTQMQGTQTVAVVICTYCASDVIEACLDSLAATTGARLHVAVCDNASPDDTVAVVTDWALRHGVTMGHAHAGDSSVGDIGTKDALPWLTLVQAPSNLGFAGGVNAGLTWFLSRPEIDLFWVLNPDSLVRPDTAAAYVARANAVGAFGLMGGRTQFVEAPGLIQSDGGRVRHWTGGIGSSVLGRPASAFANYFIFRNRMRFVARFAWAKLPVAYAVSLAQIAKMVWRGGRSEAISALRGLHGLQPPLAVQNRVAPDARARAFGR